MPRGKGVISTYACVFFTLKPLILPVDIQYNQSPCRFFYPRELPGTSYVVTKLRNGDIIKLYQVHCFFRTYFKKFPYLVNPMPSHHTCCFCKAHNTFVGPQRDLWIAPVDRSQPGQSRVERPYVPPTPVPIGESGMSKFFRLLSCVSQAQDTAHEKNK